MVAEGCLLWIWTVSGMSSMSSMDMGNVGVGGNMSSGGNKIGTQVGGPAAEGAPIKIRSNLNLQWAVCPCQWAICLHRT